MKDERKDGAKFNIGDKVWLVKDDYYLEESHVHKMFDVMHCYEIYAIHQVISKDIWTGKTNSYNKYEVFYFEPRIGGYDERLRWYDELISEDDLFLTLEEAMECAKHRTETMYQRSVGKYGEIY